jgi:hyperosmotically inducible protein
MKYFKSVVKSFFVVVFLAVFGSAYAQSAITDTAITANVKAHLLAPEYKDVSVETKEGVVTLSGNVKSETNAVEAVKIVQSLPGVVDVNPTFLKSSPSGQPLKDAYITAKIQGEYVRNNLMSKGLNVPIENISVEVKNGVAYLSGNVATQAQADQLVHLAKSVKGVVKVESTLRIQ